MGRNLLTSFSIILRESCLSVNIKAGCFKSHDCVVVGRVVGRGDRDTNPPGAVSKLGQFRSNHFARLFRKIC